MFPVSLVVGAAAVFLGTRGALAGVIAATEAPAGNPLSYAGGQPAASIAQCSVAVADHSIVYPNARIDHKTSGTIDCTSQVSLISVPAGYQFTITNVSVAGYLNLEQGSYIEKIQVRLWYPEATVRDSRDLHG